MNSQERTGGGHGGVAGHVRLEPGDGDGESVVAA